MSKETYKKRHYGYWLNLFTILFVSLSLLLALLCRPELNAKMLDVLYCVIFFSWNVFLLIVCFRYPAFCLKHSEYIWSVVFGPIAILSWLAVMILSITFIFIFPDFRRNAAFIITAIVLSSLMVTGALCLFFRASDN